MKRVPLPGWLLSSMLPRWASAEFCGDSEADAAAGRVGGPGAPPEPFEYVWLVLGGDARPGVADLKAGLAAGLGKCHLYPAAGRGEFQRVAQQVGNDLVQPAGVGFDWCGIEPALEADLGGSEVGFPVVGGSRGDQREIAWLHAEMKGGGLRRGEGLQVFD